MIGPGAGRAVAKGAGGGARLHIAGNPEIWEVILSGGDPLVLSARRIKKDVVKRLAAISHVKVIRVHTRMLAAVAPERIGAALVSRVTHRQSDICRSARQSPARTDQRSPRRLRASSLTPASRCCRNRCCCRGVNDDVETLGALMRALIECRIKPYYLHHADLAPGTAHLRTTIAEGQALMRGLRGRFPACVSRLMCWIFRTATANHRSVRTM